MPRGWEDLQLQHLYRAMAWLGEQLPATERDQHTHAPRYVKDRLEEGLFARRRQMIVGLALDETGLPVCTEMWPGNEADMTALVPVAERL